MLSVAGGTREAYGLPGNGWMRSFLLCSEYLQSCSRSFWKLQSLGDGGQTCTVHITASVFEGL